MGVKEKFVKDVAIVSVSGKLMGGDGTKAIHDHVKSLVADNVRKVVIDLSKVKWMNSQGIGTLMACYTTLRNCGGNLKLTGATEKVNNLLVITQVITIFKHYETVDRAIAAFSE